MALQYTAEMQQQQHEKMATALLTNSVRDVTFIIGREKTELKGNRAAMSSLSEPFRAMLFGAMKESQPDTKIIIDDIEPDGFQSVLNWAHLQDPQISMQNVVSVKSIARKYQISDLLTLCDQHFKECLNGQRFCSLFVQSRNHKLDEYVQKCIEFLDGNTEDQIQQILSSNGFMEMNVESMQFLLQIDNLKIAEEKIWEAVLKWKHHEIGSDANGKGEIDEEPPSKRRRVDNHNSGDIQRRDLRSVARFIRFGLMDHQYFVQNVQPTECLNQEEMLTISNYIGMRATNPDFECGSFSTVKRKGARHGDPGLRKFQHYCNLYFDVSNGGLEIKGKGSQYACGSYGYLVYPTLLEYHSNFNGVHFWSLLAEKVTCGTHQIGVMSKALSSFQSKYLESIYIWSESEDSPKPFGTWNEGDIVTVVLNCNEKVVQYFRNDDFMDEIPINGTTSYYFVLLSCSSPGHQHYRVVETPHTVKRLCR